MNTEPKKRKISVRSAKNKGQKFQKEIATVLGKIVNIPVEKDGDIDIRPSGQTGVDIILRGRAKELIKFSIECKDQETWSLAAYTKQAKANQEKNRPYLLFLTKNYFDRLVVMDLSTFTSLLEENLRLKGLI